MEKTKRITSNNSFVYSKIILIFFSIITPLGLTAIYLDFPGRPFLTLSIGVLLAHTILTMLIHRQNKNALIIGSILLLVNGFLSLILYSILELVNENFFIASSGVFLVWILIEYHYFRLIKKQNANNI